MDANRDSFSIGSADYSQFRPRSPHALFEFLASVAPGREAALDCGTGNGQAAVALTEFFQTVYATDLSAEQIAEAEHRPGLIYMQMAAEDLNFPDASFDLVTVATALHWFDLDRFYPAVHRVLKPKGVFAAWGYGFFTTTAPEIDTLLRSVLFAPIDPYWAAGNRIVENGYRTIPFPFRELEVPTFSINLEWTVDQLLGFLGTWSAVKRYEAENEKPILPQVREELDAIWPAGATIKLSMPLALRVGVV
jgi:SAM-dependent methyltransferase